jgi:hypothetical protein
LLIFHLCGNLQPCTPLNRLATVIGLGLTLRCSRPATAGFASLRRRLSSNVGLKGMDKILTLRNLLRALPGTVILAAGFLFPMLWWPTTRQSLALALYLPFLLMLIAGGCFLSFLRTTGGTVPYSHLKSVAIIAGAFLAFLVYVLLYRTFCM